MKKTVIETVKANAKTRFGGVAGGRIVKPLGKADFEDNSQAFADYKQAVEDLQAHLFAYGNGAKKNVGLCIKKIASTLEMSADETAVAVDYFNRHNIVNATINRNQLTAESKAKLKRLNKAVEVAENKAVTADYTAEMKTADIEKAVQTRKDWRETQARYLAEDVFQRSFASFRLSFEYALGCALLGLDHIAPWETSKERADTRQWLRWIDKASKLGIDPAPFKARLDLDGLKEAVKAKYAEVEKATLEALDKQAQEARQADAEPATPAEQVQA